MFRFQFSVYLSFIFYVFEMLWYHIIFLYESCIKTSIYVLDFYAKVKLYEHLLLNIYPLLEMWREKLKYP